MALQKDQVDAIVTGFIHILAHTIPVQSVFLFGSYANGKAHDYSDIDLAIVSGWFRNQSHIENMQFLSKIAARYNTLIEAVPFSPDEVEHPDKRSFAASALKDALQYPINV